VYEVAPLCAELLYSTFSPHFPASLSRRLSVKQVTIPLLMPHPEDISISLAQILCNLLGLAASLVYARTRHFLSNNGLGLAYSIEVCYRVGILLLCVAV
jgi:hypothetical protein